MIDELTLFFLIAVTIIVSMPLVIWALTTLALFISDFIDNVRDSDEKRRRTSNKESNSDTQD